MNTVEILDMIRNYYSDVCAELFSLELNGVDLREAYLHGANFTNSWLNDVDLRWVDFEGADLRGADFRGAMIHQNDLYRFDRQFRLADTRDVYIC